MALALLDRCLHNRFVTRVAHKTAFALVMLLCLLWSAWAAVEASPGERQAVTIFHEWPSQWDGEPLRPLALSEVEQRFAAHFPGSIARLTDDRSMFVMRQVAVPTRMLHPAVDCYRALGYRIEQARLERDAQERLWRCFNARRVSGQTLRVCERIVDAKGTAFTDTSAWYWAAASGQSRGPWQAVTMARPM